MKMFILFAIWFAIWPAMLLATSFATPFANQFAILFFILYYILSSISVVFRFAITIPILFQHICPVMCREIHTIPVTSFS